MNAQSEISSERNFCEMMLPKTSRTFALSVPLLNDDLYWTVLVSYLLCRILDTIEDATSISSQRKKELLRSFSSLLEIENKQAQKEWLLDLSRNTLDGEMDHVDLVLSFEKVLRVYFSLDERFMESTLVPIQTMAQGMAEFSEALEKEPLRPIENEDDLRRYCYFVAGTVGELLTGAFCAYHEVLKEKKDTLLPLSRSFGETLQLVNIMKDVSVDREREVCFLPSRLFKEGLGVKRIVTEHLLPVALSSSQKSMNFIDEIPFYLFRTRLFCLWPLWLSLVTMKKILLELKAEDYKEGQSIKISRFTLYKTLLFVTLISWVPFLLKFDYRRRCRQIQTLRSEG